jgi:hypothetical protein
MRSTQPIARCSRRDVDGSGNEPKRYQREGQGGHCRGLDAARRLLRRYGRRLGQVRLGGVPAAGAYADQVHARRATAARILAAASTGYRARPPRSRRLGGTRAGGRVPQPGRLYGGDEPHHWLERRADLRKRPRVGPAARRRVGAGAPDGGGASWVSPSPSEAWPSSSARDWVTEGRP